MSRQNAEVARQAYAAYNREGISGILEYLDAQIEWRNPFRTAVTDASADLE